MTGEEFITELFCRIDRQMAGVKKHPQAKLWPSELVTLGVLSALTGKGPRAFYRFAKAWLLPLFPHLPDRTRLFRALAAHRGWADRFLAEPSLLGIADTYAVELLHPMREGRSPRQVGKKGKSNRRWVVGVKACTLVNHLGLVVGWEAQTANVHDSRFHPAVRAFDGRMAVFVDSGFHAKEGDPQNMKVCQKKRWNQRALIETVFSMLTRLCALKRRPERAWPGIKARLGFVFAAFNLLVQWEGMEPDENGHVRLSMAEYCLV